MTDLLKLLAVTTAIGATVIGSAFAQETEINPWVEDAKEWECSLPKERPATRDKDPRYKTELYFTYGDINERTNTTPLKTFNVRHTTVNGNAYSRSDQYYGMTIHATENRNSGVQRWMGYSAKNPRVRMVGELRWVKVGKAVESGFEPMNAVYVEYVYRDNKLVTTITSKCHWTGPTC